MSEETTVPTEVSQPNTDAANVTSTETPVTQVEPKLDDPTTAESMYSDKAETQTTEEVAKPEGEEKPVVEGEEVVEPVVETAEVPEAYEDFTVPEGYELSETSKSEIKDLAKELGLPQEKAQKLADLAIKAYDKANSESTKVWQETKEQWVNEAKSDEVFGGAKFGENVDRVRRLLDTHADQETVTFLEATGYGDNPGFLKMMLNISSKLSDDVVPSNQSSHGYSVFSQSENLYGKK